MEMAVYLINHAIEGIKTKDINDEELIKGNDNTIVLVLGKEQNDQLIPYYKGVADILVSRNRLIAVSIGDECNIAKAIFNLMASHRNYNIYNVNSREVIDREYIDAIINRDPTFDEVQTFVGSDITAYSDISVIVMGIQSLIREGDIEGLKSFLERHLMTIYKFPEVVDYMKYLVDISNSGDLEDRLNELRNLVDKYKAELFEKDEKCRQLEEDNQKIKWELNKIKGEYSLLKNKAEELEKQAATVGPAIRTYNEINTSLIKCRTSIILYFKEISKIPYINSFVTMLLEILKTRKLRVKLLIYDIANGLSGLYRPLNVVGSEEYMMKREAFKTSVEKFVVVEPNPVILNDILTYSAEPYDVVIIYDRMKQVKDLVVGNNVAKFYVINSLKDYNEACNIFGAIDKSFVITRPYSRIGKEVLDIPTIENYSNLTDGAKIARYSKLMTSVSNKPLVETILEKSRIAALLKK